MAIYRYYWVLCLNMWKVFLNGNKLIFYFIFFRYKLINCHLIYKSINLGLSLSKFYFIPSFCIIYFNLWGASFWIHSYTRLEGLNEIKVALEFCLWILVLFIGLLFNANIEFIDIFLFSLFVGPTYMEILTLGVTIIWVLLNKSREEYVNKFEIILICIWK